MERSARSRETRTPTLYIWADHISTAAILFMTVFTPWFHGTTADWSIWTMNSVGYLLGLMLALKKVIEWRKDYQPARWVEDDRAGRWITVMLAVLTVAMLSWCLVAALNARASFFEDELRFEYHTAKSWLPASYDSFSSWKAFWMYLGLAAFFWALRDWLIGKTRQERRRVNKGDGSPTEDIKSAFPPTARVSLFPARLKLLLWVLCINAALVSLQGFLQRLSGSNKLLWITPAWWESPDACYGAFSYRGNAAEYLNLIWPVCLGLWWTLQTDAKKHLERSRSFTEGPHLLLIPAAILIAMGPIASLSRGGALVCAASLGLVMLAFFAHADSSKGMRRGIVIVALVLGIGGWMFAGEKLTKRFKNLSEFGNDSRTELYNNSSQIADDFPLMGTGPGTFASVYHLYRATSRQEWQSTTHDDWLETQVTFGWLGRAILMVMLLLAFTRWFVPGSVPLPTMLIRMIWIALGGCLIHAKFDFPLQIYSILFVFLLLTCVLFCSSRSERS